MYPQRLVSQALRLGLLVTLISLVLSACGGGEKESKARPLPEDPQALRPSEYHSEEFKPSLSFRVGKGWSSTPLESSDLLGIARGETAELNFVVTQEVYEPTKTGTPNVVNAPKDLVGWFQHHPYLQTSKPEPLKVGGVKGKQFDVGVGDLPENYLGVCHSVVGTEECVDVARLSTGRTTLVSERSKLRLIVLEDVEGKTVTIAFGSPKAEFDEFAPEAQKVVDSVKWGGS